MARDVPPVGDGGPCLDESTLAAFAEDRLPATARETVERHLVGCDACRESLGWALSGEEGAADVVARSRGRRRWRWVAAAAALLVGGGVAWWISRGPSKPEDPDARLVAAAHDLARADTLLFQDFAPIEHAERVAVEARRERGGLVVVEPRDAVLSPRPRFRWLPVPGADRYEVQVLTAEATPVWKGSTEEASIDLPSGTPDLAPGRYLWSVTTQAPLQGSVEARQAFSVASPNEVATFERAKALVAERLSADLRLLVLSHWALRHTWSVEAERLAREHVTAHPEDPIGRETLVYLLRRRGDPEADALAKGSP